MQERYKRLGINTILVFIGKSGSAIIGLLMLPFYTHWLSTDEYGTTDLITTYAAILMGFMTCCISDAIFIFPKDADEKGRTYYYTSGYLFVAITTFLFGVGLFLLRYLGNRFSWGGIFFERTWFILVFAICQFLQQYSQSFTRSIDKMRVYSLSGIVYTGSIALFSFFLLPRWGLDGYLYAMISANLVSTCFTVFASGAYKYISIRGYSKESLHELLKYGIPLVPNGLMWWLVNGLNRPIMEANLGLEALGLYAVANKFPLLLSTLVGIFNTAWSITVLEEFGKPDFNRFFNRTVKMLYFVMVLGACLIAVLSKLIIVIFADDSYFEAWKYIPVLTLSIVFQNFSGIVGGVFSAEKQSKYFFYSSIWGAVSSLVATFVFIRLWGLQGAAIAVAFSFFVMSLVRLFYTWKHINEMKLLWYFIMTLLYILFIVIVLFEFPIYISIPLYFVIISAVFFFSKDVITPVWETVKGFMLKK